jgi:acylaminoacyl-peptidase
MTRSTAQEALDSGRYDFQIIPIPDRHPVESIVIRLKKRNENADVNPVITRIHGGPHAVTTTEFDAYNICLAMQGCE